MTSTINTIFYIGILIMSVVVHEVAHGVAAERYGDPTARMSGRLTLNPLKHLDWFGSFVLPLILIMAGTQPIGWAKPVPVNPNNVKSKMGRFVISAAGIFTNFLVALIGAFVLRSMAAYGIPVDHINPSPTVLIIDSIVLINILLGIFNLIPVPPLDGFKILFSLLPARFGRYESVLDMYGIPILFILIFTFGSYLTPIVFKIMGVLLGV
jgi:Zn-dependent protease